jgi:hypothetical protein
MFLTDIPFKGCQGSRSICRLYMQCNTLHAVWITPHALSMQCKCTRMHGACNGTDPACTMNAVCMWCHWHRMHFLIFILHSQAGLYIIFTFEAVWNCIMHAVSMTPHAQCVLEIQIYLKMRSYIRKCFIRGPGWNFVWKKHRVENHVTLSL